MQFNLTEVLDNLFFVERGYLNANHFVYRGRSPVLIDTGYIADLQETRRILSHLGVRFRDVRTIITTHCHCDHIGGNNRIQRRSGCEIRLHEIGKMFIESRDDWSTWWKYYGQQAEFFDCHRPLQDGDGLSVGPHHFDVYHTPGHAADGIVLYHRETKLLISSDTLWERDLPVHTVRVEGSTAAYLTRKSLEKIAGLDVECVCPGHGPLFSDFHGALDRSRMRIKGYLRDREKIGQDVLKKIMVYTLLMKTAVASDRFFSLLMETHWFRETVDFYFEGAYHRKYEEIMASFVKKGVVRQEGDLLRTTVKP